MKRYPERLWQSTPLAACLVVAALSFSHNSYCGPPRDVSAPQLTSVADAAAGLPILAPGMLVRLSGTNLSPVTATADTSPLPSTLGGVTVHIDGLQTTQAQLLSVAPEQIQAILPLHLQGDSIQFQTATGGTVSNTLSAALQPSVPRIFTNGEDGKGNACAYHSDGTPISAGSPLRPRERTRVLLTGLGPNATSEAFATPDGEDHAAETGIRIELNGVIVPTLASGSLPALPGVNYVEFDVPATPLPAGAITLTITSAGTASQPGVTLPTASNEFFVSPTGAPSATGALDDPWDLATALKPHPSIRPGDTVWLREGTYGDGLTQFESRLQGEPGNPVVLRQYAGERAIINGGLAIFGPYTWYWGFEVANTNRDRSQYPEAIDTYTGSIGVKLINLILHDTAQGVGFWEAAPDAEIHGSLIFHNGYQGSDRGHGHGIYAQNRTGTKTISDNIIFNQFATGIHVYGSEKAAATGFRIRGNIVFNNGSIAQGISNVDNILLAVGTPMSGMIVQDNYTFHTPSLNQGTSRLGWIYGVPNIDLTATNNYWIGGFSPLECWRWQKITYRGNVSYAPKQFPVLFSSDAPLAAGTYSWDANTYYGNDVFRLNAANVDFSQWRAATGFDASSRYIPGQPKGQWIFLRVNQYESGRAHIVIYNWDLAAAAAVDLSSVLKTGDAFQIRDAQNFFGPPLVSARFDGKPVTIPLRPGPVTQPVSDIPSPPKHTAPAFNVFVVLKDPPSR